MITLLILIVFVAPVLIVAYYAMCGKIIAEAKQKRQMEDIKHLLEKSVDGDHKL